MNTSSAARWWVCARSGWRCARTSRWRGNVRCAKESSRPSDVPVRSDDVLLDRPVAGRRGGLVREEAAARTAPDGLV